ncbi:unnamed protein product [Cochlearia groenlandica]
MNRYHLARHLVSRYFSSSSSSVSSHPLLPTPFGLVRSGVAPDHPETEIVINQFSRVAQHERCSFYGNVKLGSDLSLSELRDLYHVVVLAYGAESDKDLGISGENLSGVHSAREFVWWYNGHPDYSGFKPDLKSSDTAVILGQGNVALDVARILLRPTIELASTDIVRRALSSLEESSIRKVYLIGRRGPVQAALTTKELREVLRIKNLHIQIKEADLSITPADEEEMKSNIAIKKIYELLSKAAAASGTLEADHDQRELHFVFFRQPSQFLESDERKGHVYGVNLEKTIIESVGSGKQIAVVTTNGMSMCSILQFGVEGHWLQVVSVSEDIEEGVCKSAKEGCKGLMQLLEKRNVKKIDFSRWEKIDAKEKQMGSESNKPIDRSHEMIY